uniref:CRIB domain-containing protein n=1 Tax=Oryza meridionalis TaxID=40149 RepID=A0A0E0CC73_9ORYZ
MSSSGKEQRRMDRFIVIPFSSTCRNGSSVDVVDGGKSGKKPQVMLCACLGGGGGGGGGEGGGGAAENKPKGESLVARLLRGFKNLSQIFAVYEDDDDEEEEREMVIGLPTDVKHVAHIGWDGSTNTTTSLRSWNRAAPPPPSSSSSSAAAASTSSALPAPAPAPPLPAFSMRQFELAMAAQAAATGTTTTSGGVAS